MHIFLYAYPLFPQRVHKYALLKTAGFAGTQTQGIPHHLMMASFDPAREEEINHMLQQVCGTTPCFSLPFHHIGLFGLKVLFLAPDVNAELLSLHQKLSLGQPDGENGWSAHATLLIDEPEAILKALPIVADHFKGFTAEVKVSPSMSFFRPALSRNTRFKRFPKHRRHIAPTSHPRHGTGIRRLSPHYRRSPRTR